MSESRVVAVALPLPVQSTFSYRVPEALPLPDPGARVLVPFGARRVLGVVVGAEPEGERSLKDVVDVIDEVPLAPPSLLALAAWTAEHYLAPPGECHRLTLPPSGIRASRAVARLAEAQSGDSQTESPSGAGTPAEQRGGHGEVRRTTPPIEDDPVLLALRDGPLAVSTLARRLGKDPTARLARLRRAGLVIVDQDLRAPGFRQVRVAQLTAEDVAPRGIAQAEVLDRLKKAGGRLRVPALVGDRPALRGALDRLVAKGAVSLTEEREVRSPEILEGAAAGSLTLTTGQTDVVGPILEAVSRRTFAAFLLHGITGSGKTEVYFRAAERALALGRGVLILVPEIALTPLLVRAAAARFGSTVSVIHSELSAGERHDQWWRIREGESGVVIGARSAVFAPLPDAGLIVVDEEHEGSYKQEESPRYHARDVAVVRAKLEGAVVVLGSATPSVESYTNAQSGKYTHLALGTRIGPRGLPKVEVVDRREVLKSGGDPILTPLLRDALVQCLGRGEQSLLLLNRRGYATSLLCRECGEQAACPNCSVSLALHEGGRMALCHYCGYRTATPPSCASCRGDYLRLAGYGTEKVVEAVRLAVPRARIERVDRDLAQRRGAVGRVLAAFEAGEADVLVGTQMIAKGHDFPRVTLVGVVDADVGLGLPDFRAAERTFQLLTQVAGRAGRADLAGEVILQSHLPDHYALRFACAQDYEAFYEREMEFRRTMSYPPAAALLNLVLRSREAGEAGEHAEAIARRLRETTGQYRVLGPARAPLARLRQEHRFQILLKGQRAAMRTAVQRALEERFGNVRWPGVAVDVDPVSVM